MGASGADRIVKVPVGICVKSEEGRTLGESVNFKIRSKNALMLK